MQANDAIVSGDSQVSAAHTPIAPWWHFAGFLAIMAGICGMGFLAQHSSGGSPGGADSGQLAGHSQAIRIYLTAAFMDWALLYYCWVGVHRRGGTLATLSGGRWQSWKALGIDAAIMIPFFVLWEGAAYGLHWLLGASSAKTVDSLLPQSALEVMLWIGVSITAGICEEMAFRGYLQRQFLALGGGAVVAVFGQGIVFGVAHAYQGWKNVIVISVLGMIYGAMAAWRKNLGVNILAHSFTDIWEGWLKFLAWR